MATCCHQDAPVTRAAMNQSPFPWLSFLVCLLVALATPLEAGQKKEGKPKEGKPKEGESIVVVLSWDGMRNDYPDRGDYPALARMAREGARATLTPVYPSSTFPGHVSLATGTYPDRHGILDNHFFDRERGEYHYASDADWLDAEPLWIAAERQGVRTATYFWVGSETDWRGQGVSYRIAPFDASRSEQAKVQQILAWLALPAAERPRLIMCYWRGPDSVGHRKGPEHEDVFARIKDQDRRLQSLLLGIDELGLWPLTTLMLVSDHGMTEVEQFVDIGAPLREAGIEARIMGGASVKHLFIANPVEIERAQSILRSIPGLAVTQRAELDPKLRISHPSRTGDLVVRVEPPLGLGEISPTAAALHATMAVSANWRYGAHGFDPALSDMKAVFFAMGRGFRGGDRLGDVHQVDVAPTVARLLGIDKPRDAEGQSLRLHVQTPGQP